MDDDQDEYEDRREGAIERGFRGGVSGCVGCLTFAVLGLVFLVVAINACSGGS